MRGATMLQELVDSIAALPIAERVAAINDVKRAMHAISPFCNEPVDCVEWVPAGEVFANEYNPNKVAPPEMELLEVSITNDGYTQPIVTWPIEAGREVVDGFHRSRVGKESALVSQRVHGYLPVVTIRSEQHGKSDRIASTIRHNRARGKHQVDAMSEIVLELKARNWTNKRIAKELGMDEDEILRLCQVSGLQEMFLDQDFSRAWEAEDDVLGAEFIEITDEISKEERDSVRTANTSDPNRVFHTFDKWECVAAGMHESKKDGWTTEQCEQAYVDLLTDVEAFRAAANQVIAHWPNSCEQNLTNTAMNRLAWIGQASVCYTHGVPAKFCGGWSRLTDEQKLAANAVALDVLNAWLSLRGIDAATAEEAVSIGRQVEIY